MYGASKLGRGGAGTGRGTGAKRGVSSMLPPQRRLSLGANSRGRGATPAPPAVEETFSLVTGRNPLAFAMIIRLAPDLVDEIKRLESAGGTARIKFDSVANNPTGNVIDVGGKEFKFTSSRETGDLCDIYEQRESGEDGDGLLVESGCAWRKLNVQRILDESTKNHVKKLSEEAKREKDLRRAIVLEPGNPSMKSQIKQLVAVETNPWKQFKHKKEPPPKKRKTEAHPVAVSGPPKLAYKSGMSSTAIAKAKHSSSPIPSPPEQSDPAASPFKAVNAYKNHTSAADAIFNEVIAKDKPAMASDKEIPPRATSTSVAREVIGRKSNVGTKPMDLQSMLCNLLKENPKGMSLKALENAVGDSIPNSVRQIETILKRIATSQVPGRYLLKSESESEGVKKPSLDSESSPEENLHLTPAAEENVDHLHALESDLKEGIPLHEIDEKELLDVENLNALTKTDTQQHSPDPVGERKASENSDGHAASSSDSGSDSDSDSDSSDSGSDSGSPSRSRSKSPVGSGSGSSSDSDSDASSNSKEGSDVDVDIMSDDDKEPKQKLQPEAPFSRSPAHWRSPDGRPVQVGNDEKQDDHEFDAVDIEEDMPDGKEETEMGIGGISFPSKEHQEPIQKPCSPNQDELQERQNFIGSLFDLKENTPRGDTMNEKNDSSERKLKGKHKRAMDMKHSGNKPEKAKRSKTETARQLPISGGKNVHLEVGSSKFPSDRLEDPYTASIQAVNGSDREGNDELTIPKGDSEAITGKSSADFQHSGRRLTEQGAERKAFDVTERPDNPQESMGHGRKSFEKSSHIHEGSALQKCKSHKGAPHQDGYANEPKASRNIKETSVKGKKLTPSDSHRKKHGVIGKAKDAGQVPGSFLGPSVKENSKTGGYISPAVNGRGGRLQREYSELELGELREPPPEETPSKKKFERKGSFKQSENKPVPLDNWISDTSKGRLSGKSNIDFGKPSGLDLNSKDLINLEGSEKKRNYEDRSEDIIRSQQRMSQQHLRVVDNGEAGPQSNKLEDTNGNSRQNEASARPGNDLEGYGESNRRVPAPQLHDSRRESVSNSSRERKRGTSNALLELPNGQNESLLADGNNSDRKRRDSSSDENSCSYSKYEKDEPDLKGPIKDPSQYKEYVQEYRDKYDSYCSLNKILESYRSEFQKLGKELERTKDRDSESYYNILGQLKESYSQCGARHKRLKKIFVVLHEELKHLKQRIRDFALSYAKD